MCSGLSHPAQPSPPGDSLSRQRHLCSCRRKESLALKRSTAAATTTGCAASPTAAGLEQRRTGRGPPAVQRTAALHGGGSGGDMRSGPSDQRHSFQVATRIVPHTLLAATAERQVSRTDVPGRIHLPRKRSGRVGGTGSGDSCVLLLLLTVLLRDYSHQRVPQLVHDMLGGGHIGRQQLHLQRFEDLGVGRVVNLNLKRRGESV